MDYFQMGQLATKYNLPIEDVILIALNRYGLLADIADNRLRFKLRLNSYNEAFYFAVCINTYASPFSLQGNDLLLNGECIGHIFDIEKDTCDSTYFRRGGTALTLNSNARSQCQGCKFCGTYQQGADDLNKLTTEESLAAYIEKLISCSGLTDLSHLCRISLCTACFDSEQKLVEHIIMVKQVLSRYNFQNKLHYIGSELTSDSALETIKNEIGDFSLTFTVECFTNRSKLMRDTKAKVQQEEVIRVLEKAKSLDFATNIIYILGMDPLKEVEKNFRVLSPYMNRFPLVQVYQNYIPEHENLRLPEAKGLDYYLEGRKIIENIFGAEKFKPRSWENYRSLWYVSYNNEQHKSIRI